MGLFTRATDYGPAIEAMRAEIATLRGEIGRLGERIERGSTVQLRADLDNLVGRVEGIAASMQRQFGRLYAERSTPAPAAANGSEIDDELADLLEFQRREGAH